MAVDYFIHHHEADIVSVVAVFRTWIAKPDQQKHRTPRKLEQSR